MLAKIIELVKQYQRDIFLGLCIVLISIVSFNLGKINSSQKEPISIKDGANIYKAVSVENPGVASKSQEQIVRVTPKPKSAVDLRVVASKKSKTKLNGSTTLRQNKSSLNNKSKLSDSTILHQVIDYVFTIDYKPGLHIKDPKTGCFTSEIDYQTV